jgi:hypothetical protein
MKKLRFVLWAAIAATAVTSCNSDDDVITGAGDRVEVKFAAGNLASVETRAAEVTWATGDSIGVFMIKETPGTLASGNILESADNIRYNTQGGAGAAGFTANGTNIYYPVDGNVKFVAYYPYTQTISNYAYSFSVASQASQPAIDVLYAPAGASYNKTAATATLPFTHKLVKLVFNISNGAGVTASLSGLTVKISGQLSAGSLDLTTGAVTASGATQEITALTAQAGTASEAIVLPAADNTGKILSFTNTAGETFTADLNAVTPAFAGGNRYTYTVTLKKTAVGIVGNITQWTDGGTSSVTAE